MGNTESSGGTANLLSGFKRAQDAQNSKLYQLVDYKGRGELVQWMKYALGSGDYSIFDSLLEVKVAPFLYGAGKGKLLPISDLVKIRNKERNAMLGALRRKKGKGKSGPNIFADVNQEEMQGDMMKALKMLDGGGKNAKGGSKYKDMCWDLNQRGAMGETLLHICFLHGTTLHNEVAKRLVLTYPKLVNEIYLSEDYYGQTALHQAIVNEDAAMVRFLLRHGADIHARCYGSFFCPDDQRATRTDSLEHEAVDVNERTNYGGKTYWGEYPLFFAACTRQMESFRLLRANKADPNAKDTNGNTVLHLMVIHGYCDMFDLAHRLGAKLHIANNQNLTPLTLAAKLGKKEMFEHVLTIESDILWTYGGVTCAAYPLCYIDTIEEQTGEINKLSALSLIVYGESTQHLELLDGLIEDLLAEKWKAFGKKKILQQLSAFLVYFICVFVAFLLRPLNSDEFYNTLKRYKENRTLDEVMNIFECPINDTDCNYLKSENCVLRNMEFDLTSKIRFVAEGLTILGSVCYLIRMGFQIKHLGLRLYLKTLISFPAICSLNLSFFLVLLIFPIRFFCIPNVENVLAVIVVLTTTFHFLFYWRATKLVGPFVLMFYKMLAGDVLRFFVIYIIFVMGFSQSFFIVLLGCHDGQSNIDPEDLKRAEKIANPVEAVLRMFVMSIGEFTFLYGVVKTCRLGTLGKLVFIVYELLVTIMLINMLIASMARTYDELALTQKEWKRQWAKVILMLEQSCRPKERLLALLKYSRPIGIDKNKRAFVVRRKLMDEEKTDISTKRLTARKAFVASRKLLYKRRMMGETIGSSGNPIPPEAYVNASHLL